MDHENDPSSIQNVSEHASDQVAPIRRTSSRIATRRMNRDFQSVHSRPYPAQHIQHLTTWLSQNRQMERQRNYYSNYYSNNRNRSPQLNTNLNSEGHTPSAVEPQPSPPPQASIPAVASTTSSSSISSETTTGPPFERITSIIRINDDATQTNSNTNTVTVTDTSTGSNTSNANNNQSFLLTPLHDYIRTIGAFITYSHVGRPQTIVVNTTSSNAINNNDNSHTVSIDYEPNLDTIFNFHENYLTDGLTKQEINRHTISYEYKPILSSKRKRIKTEDEPPSTSAVLVNDNCSICLDKFNPNVHVRRLPCLHVFHIKCIDKWLKRNKKCPICRISITINYDTLISSLGSGSTIDQCLNQQESSHNRNQIRPTITFSLQRNLNNEFSLASGIVHATVELNTNNSTTNSSSGTANTN